MSVGWFYNAFSSFVVIVETCAVCNSNLNWKLPFSFFFFFGLSAAERLTFESVTNLVLLFLHAQHGNKELTLSAKVLILSCQLCSDKNESPRLLIQNLKRPGASLQRKTLCTAARSPVNLFLPAIAINQNANVCVTTVILTQTSTLWSQNTKIFSFCPFPGFLGVDVGKM